MSKYLDAIIAVVVLAVGIFIGYTVGNWHSSSLKKQLDTLVTAEAVSAKENVAAVKQLKATNQDLQAKYDEAEALHKTELASAQTVFEKQSADKDRLIASLKLKAKTGTDLVSELQTKLAQAKTAPEKAVIQAEITQQQEQNTHDQAQVTGLECLSAQVPDNFVEALSGTWQSR